MPASGTRTSTTKQSVKTAGLKKYEVISPPFARKPKGMRIWQGDGGQRENGEPTGEQVYVEVGKTVELTPAAAQPLIDSGRLKAVEG